MFQNEISIIELEKISNRVKESKHPMILERISNLHGIDYKVFGHQSCVFDPNEPIFTILFALYDANLEYIIQGITSILNQTYRNTELIIIDNGSTGAISNYLDQLFLGNHQIKLLRASSNQYEPQAGDSNPLIDLLNAGLFSSVGEYIFFQSYDDVFSQNYVELMVRLFKENPNCVSATPSVCSIDANGDINIESTQELANLNLRNRYEKGIVLAQNKMRNIHTITAPGTLLAQKSNTVINFGGFDSINDLTQIFRFAILGDVGFDRQAKLFWRHHELQTNKNQSRLGISYYKEYLNMPIRYGLHKVHSDIAGPMFADEFERYLCREASEMAITNIASTLFRYGHNSGTKALFALMREAGVVIILKGIWVWFRVSIHLILRRNRLLHRIVVSVRNNN